MEKFSAFIKREEHIDFAIILLLVSLPFSKGLTSVAVVGLFLMSLFKVKRISFPVIRHHIPVVMLALFVLLMGVTVLYSGDIAYGIKMTLRLKYFVFLPVIALVNSARINKNLSFYLKFLIYGVLLSGAIIVILYLLPAPKVIWLTKNLPFFHEFPNVSNRLQFGLYSPFIDRLQYSYILAIGFFSQIWLLFQQRSVFGVVSLVFIFAVIILLGARGTQVGILFGIVIWAIAYIRQKTVNKAKVWGYSLGVIGALLLFSFVGFKTIPALNSRYKQLMWELEVFYNGQYVNYEYRAFTGVNRLLSWKNSLEIIKKNPVFGVGIGDVQAEMDRQYAADNPGFVVTFHNQYLMIMLAAGIVGLIFFLIMLISWIRRQAARTTGSLWYLSLSIFVFYLIIFLFDIPLMFHTGGITFGVFYSLLGVYEEAHHKSEN